MLNLACLSCKPTLEVPPCGCVPPRTSQVEIPQLRCLIMRSEVDLWPLWYKISRLHHLGIRCKMLTELSLNGQNPQCRGRLCPLSVLEIPRSQEWEGWKDRQKDGTDGQCRRGGIKTCVKSFMWVCVQDWFHMRHMRLLNQSFQTGPSDWKVTECVFRKMPTYSLWHHFRVT